MNCPKCNVCLAVATTPDRSFQYVCVRCEWESESVNALVLASPAYRLAQLKAQGAEPGWYGPDGRRCLEYHEDSMYSGHIVWAGDCVQKEHARLCGFVEVPHE
jgi:hypothetical protein